MISANTRNLIQVISIGGSEAARYFAVTSDKPRNTVEARISAMPLNGRSLCADAFGAAGLGLRSDKGIGALSSLAAAAGGGVTGNSKGGNRNGGGVLKNPLRPHRKG